MLRGEEVVTLSVEAPPPQSNEERRMNTGMGGPGIGRAAGRGVPVGGMMGVAVCRISFLTRLHSFSSKKSHHSRFSKLT